MDAASISTFFSLTRHSSLSQTCQVGFRSGLCAASPVVEHPYPQTNVKQCWICDKARCLVGSMADHSQSITTLSAAGYCLECQGHLRVHGSCHYNQRAKTLPRKTPPDHNGTSAVINCWHNTLW
ncbi:hypothetical protein GDO78_018342 [Eleutherodactylus coqui]|uniref:Uncharacterized protein n=1 Tax=Eleutherodactylus coqui TaxID=57060 RepID=A0A8J6BCH2_ELECQ|nr:hypothetical protein GDO78_018342 [Eleutherodactylus coqui]